MTGVLSKLRYSRDDPCPICGGWERAPRGQGTRCHGYRSADGAWARCSRDEHAGDLAMEPNTTTYVHRLVDDCHCGRAHDQRPRPVGHSHHPATASPRQRILTTYDYADDAGTLLYQVVRFDPKGFAQRRPALAADPPDDVRDGWVWKLNGTRRVPYHLPELLAADPGRFVVITEGEKDADALCALGLVATTAPEGAEKWRNEFAAYFIDRRVVILPDNDEPGRRHAEQVARSLAGIADEVRIVQLPGLLQSGDVSDWLAAGGTVPALKRLVRDAPVWSEPADEPAPTTAPAAPTWQPAGYRAGELLALDLPEPRHIVDGLLAEGSAILAGRPKIGKSWLSLQLAIAVARGAKVFGQATTNGGDVAYLALEDNARRLKSRLAKLLDGSKPPARLWVFTEWRRMDDGGLEALDAWLTGATEPRLVIIDTLARFKSRRGRNVDPYDHDHAVMSQLTQLAGKHRVAILLVHHTRKALSDDFIDSVTGTLGLSGGTDATLVLARSRGQADALLSITGRDVDEQELALSFDAESCTWTFMGDADDYRLSTARRDVVNAMTAANEPMMPVQVAKVLGKNRNTIRWHMAEMAKDGTLKAWADGKYTVIGHDDREKRKQGQQVTQGQQAQQDRDLLADGAVEPAGAVGPVGSPCSVFVDPDDEPF
jgi:hypothetical protein